MTNTKIIYPCKSINQKRWLDSQGILSIHKYTDIKDGRDCWLYLQTDELSKALTTWSTEKPTLNK
jgi:hypothetical protein